MSTFWAVRPRAVRLHLSDRYWYLRRCTSTIADVSKTSPPSPRAPPSFFKRNRGSIIWSSLALTFGLIGGNLVAHTMAPPAMPDPDSYEDKILMADLNKEIDNEFKVQILRGKCLGVARQLKGEEGGWVEVIPPSAEEPMLHPDNLMSNFRGAKGLGVERVFFDRTEKRLVAVIRFGPSLCGWPGVTHGGMLATELVEKMALTATLAENRGGALSEAAIPQRMPGTGTHAKMLAPTTYPDEPTHLSVSYVKPTYANNFYVVRVTPYYAPPDQSSRDIVPSEPSVGHEYVATLETMDGQICVKAKARFNPTKSFERVEGRIKEVARTNYTEFKDWLWPSRQKKYTHMTWANMIVNSQSNANIIASMLEKKKNQIQDS